MEAIFKRLAANPYILLFVVVGGAVLLGKDTVKGYGFGMVASAIIVGAGLSAWASTVTRCPQVLHNVRVASKPPLESVAEIREAVERAERELAGSGRVLLRYSGTEPILRVMVEGEDESRISRTASELKELVAARLGGPGAGSSTP